MSNSHSIWVKLDRYPPVLVRLLATAPWDRRYIMSDELIRRRSGGLLTLADIKRLSYAPNWEGIPVDKMRAFVLACNVDFSNRARMRTLNRSLRTNGWVSVVRRDRNFPEYRTMLAQLLPP